jgi:hypothetical protein
MEKGSKDASMGYRIVATADGVPTRTIYLASILAMVSIFGAALADGSTICLGVLYVFPIAASAFIASEPYWPALQLQSPADCNG